MVKGQFVFFAVFLFTLLSAFALAEEPGAIPLKDHNAIPYLLVGRFVGRTGTAVGSSMHVEITPPALRGFGLYLFLSRSGVNDHKDRDGVTANFSDVWIGPGIIYHMRVVKQFYCSPFFQTGYAETKVHASFPDRKSVV